MIENLILCHPDIFAKENEKKILLRRLLSCIFIYFLCVNFIRFSENYFCHVTGRQHGAVLWLSTQKRAALEESCRLAMAKNPKELREGQNKQTNKKTYNGFALITPDHGRLSKHRAFEDLFAGDDLVRRDLDSRLRHAACIWMRLSAVRLRCVVSCSGN